MKKLSLLERISKLAREVAAASSNGNNLEAERLARELFTVVQTLFETTELQAKGLINFRHPGLGNWCLQVHETASKAQAALKMDREDISLHYEARLKALFQPPTPEPREFIN